MKFIFTLLTSALLSVHTFAVEVGGIELPESLESQVSPLSLNGSGVRSKFFMDIYAAGLYLTQSNQEAASIIEQDKPMALRLHITSGLLTSEKMENATREGFEKSTAGNTAGIQTTIDDFIETFKESIVENDIFDFVYTPNQGISVIKNGELKKVLEGLLFKQALFGIWLSNDAVSDDLKSGLLGTL